MLDVHFELTIFIAGFVSGIAASLYVYYSSNTYKIISAANEMVKDGTADAINKMLGNMK